MYFAPGYGNPMGFMNGQDKLLKLLLEAMKDERHDTVKYKIMMEKTNDPEIKKQIKFAYDDEIKHYGMFNSIYRALTGKTVDIPLPKTVEKYDTLMDAVKSSIEGENEAVDLYRQIYSLLTNQNMKDMVYEIITDEQEHAMRFIYVYSMMKK